jgi:ribosomal-protein-alanine N-acetyltransferase
LTADPTNETPPASRNIRLATLGDIPAIKALEASAGTAAHWSGDQYKEAMSSHTGRVILIIEDRAQLLGFVVAASIGDEWEIENLVVAQESRRKGLASKILAEAIDHAAKNGGQSLFLEVRESNTAARQFYEKWGFLEVGRRKRYYQQPVEDAIIYKRILV